MAGRLSQPGAAMSGSCPASRTSSKRSPGSATRAACAIPGTWTPTCPINWITPNGFYGVPDFAHRKPIPTVRDNPLCWLPHNEVDNSNGGQVWITSDTFGPLSRQLLHSSYGKCKLYLVMKD